MTDDAQQLLLVETSDAWFEYLESTRNQGEQRYREVEPWAWARLQQRLRAINARAVKAARTGSQPAAAPGTATRPGL